MERAQTPGTVLRQARSRGGISLKELSTVTRISHRMLSCLEKDHYDEIPGDVFARGFLRSCARELDLDSAELIELYERHTGNQTTRRTLSADEEGDVGLDSLLSAGPIPRFSYAIAILAIILGLGLAILIFGQSDTEQLTNSNDEPTLEMTDTETP